MFDSMSKSVEAFWEQVARVWETGVFGLGLTPIIAGFVVVLVFIALRGPATRALFAVLRRVTSRTASRFDDAVLDALETPARFLFVIIGLFFAMQIAATQYADAQNLDIVIRSLIAFTIFWALYRLVGPLSYLFNRILGRVSASGSGRETLRDFFVKLLRVLIVALGAAAVLQEWGFNVAAVLGGLGLAGMALALAAKDIIANVFYGAMVFMNRIFEKGNWIKTPSVEGVVEDVGLFATRIRRFDKALVTVQNAHLTAEPVINFSRMTYRRVFWMITLEYRTTSDQLRAITGEIRDYVAGHDGFVTDDDDVPFLVFVDSFNDSSIDIMLYCFTRTTAWAEWMAAKEELAYAVKDIVERNGAGFAFPSRSLYVEHWPLGTPEPFPGAEAPAPERRAGAEDGVSRES